MFTNFNTISESFNAPFHLFFLYLDFPFLNNITGIVCWTSLLLAWFYTNLRGNNAVRPSTSFAGNIAAIYERISIWFCIKSYSYVVAME